MKSPIRCSLVAWAGMLLATGWMNELPGEEPAIDFGRDVLPILSDHCFQCHGPDEKSRQADLRLDDRESLFHRPNATTVVIPGDSPRSLLFERVVSSDPDLQMPPPTSKRQLSKHQIELLRRWIDRGATWGKHWAYEPPRAAELPAVQRKDWPINEIDTFTLAKMESERIVPSPEAPRETLIRRVTLDLTGLLPSLHEVDAFLDDDSPAAYEKVVDRLLKSPRFGERLAWDWLDAGRYADTNGFQGDPERTMWPWRDWVVQAINHNMPYDQFTVEQLAGDLLPEATEQQRLASGFHRNNMHNGEGGRIAEETRVENVFDRVETTATVWLGVTFTCCRCHDHKYDPFTLKDYFGMYDIFNQMSENGSGRGGQAPPTIDMVTREETQRVSHMAELVAAAAQEVAAYELKKFPRPEGVPLSESEAIKLPGNLPSYIARTEPAKRNVDQLLEAIGYFESDGQDTQYVQLLKKSLDAVRKHDSAQKNVTKVMIMDQLEKLRDTFILSKGAYDKPTDTQVLGALPVSLTQRTPDGPRRLNRLDLAYWLVSAENPLTARVTVNRFWQSLFGAGLVRTVEDFGVQGEKPSHPELLDWLAVEFVRSGWDVKALYKRIVMSATYRQSSKVTADSLERDPENRWLARGPRYRLPAWMLRDIALSTSGLLSDTLGGPSVKPYQPEGIWEEATFGKKSYEQDHGESLYRRSLYVFWRRIVGPTMFFDNAARQTCTVKQFRTNTPLHALSTLNDTTYVEAARVMAEKLIADVADSQQRIRLAFRRVTARWPSPNELGILERRLSQLNAEYASDRSAADKLLKVGESSLTTNAESTELAALTVLCQLILNLDEAVSKE